MGSISADKQKAVQLAMDQIERQFGEHDDPNEQQYRNGQQNGPSRRVADDGAGSVGRRGGRDPDQARQHR